MKIKGEEGMEEGEMILSENKILSRLRKVTASTSSSSVELPSSPGP